MRNKTIDNARKTSKNPNAINKQTNQPTIQPTNKQNKERDTLFGWWFGASIVFGHTLMLLCSICVRFILDLRMKASIEPHINTQTSSCNTITWSIKWGLHFKNVDLYFVCVCVQYLSGLSEQMAISYYMRSNSLASENKCSSDFWFDCMRVSFQHKSSINK